MFAWKLKVRFEEDRAVLGILTSYIESKKASCLGTAVKRGKDESEGIYGAIQFLDNKGEFESWKTYCIDMWDCLKKEKNTRFPPLIYPLPSTTKFKNDKPDEEKEDKYVKIQYQFYYIETEPKNITSTKHGPKKFLMPSVFVWCKAPNSDNKIGMQVTNAFPWRNYNNGCDDEF